MGPRFYYNEILYTLSSDAVLYIADNFIHGYMYCFFFIIIISETGAQI